MTCIWRRRAETASYRDVAGWALCDGVHWGRPVWAIRGGSGASLAFGGQVVVYVLLW